MNSEQQTSENQTSLENTKHNPFNPLLILASIAGVSFVVYKLLKQVTEGFIGDEFPPIIIKSGSFVIEFEEKIGPPSGGTGGNPYVYKSLNFKEIKGVRVFIDNEVAGSAICHSYEHSGGVEVDIWFQDYSGNAWQPVPSLGNPNVTIKGEGSPGKKDFVLKIEKELQKKGNPNPKRKDKLRDKDNDTFRIARIRVREGGVNKPLINNVEGDHYMIAFYN